MLYLTIEQKLVQSLELCMETPHSTEDRHKRRTHPDWGYDLQAWMTFYPGFSYSHTFEATWNRRRLQGKFLIGRPIFERSNSARRHSIQEQTVTTLCAIKSNACCAQSVNFRTLFASLNAARYLNGSKSKSVAHVPLRSCILEPNYSRG
jgi:hypothetical protein